MNVTLTLDRSGFEAGDDGPWWIEGMDGLDPVVVESQTEADGSETLTVSGPKPGVLLWLLVEHQDDADVAIQLVQAAQVS